MHRNRSVSWHFDNDREMSVMSTFCTITRNKKDESKIRRKIIQKYTRSKFNNVNILIHFRFISSKYKYYYINININI